jgi:hypothetical protein
MDTFAFDVLNRCDDTPGLRECILYMNRHQRYLRRSLRYSRIDQVPTPVGTL